MREDIGFSGTRTLYQPSDLALVHDIIGSLPVGTRVITGACIGVDATVARMAHARGLKVHTIVPADRTRVDPEWEHYASTFQEMEPGTTFRDRNVEIVNQSDRLIAIPDHAEREPQSRRSGTWQTIRLARKDGLDVEIHVLCGECGDRASRPSQRGGNDGAGTGGQG